MPVFDFLTLTTEEIEALMFHNKGDTQETFIFSLELTDRNWLSSSPGYLPSDVAKQVTSPAVILGAEYSDNSGSPFAGGCVGWTCSGSPAGLGANAGGTPSTGAI
jgi:hypothetical protein